VKPLLVVSRCLGFEACRYDGSGISERFVAKLAPFVQFMPVCPEAEIGLETPRLPVRLGAQRVWDAYASSFAAALSRPPAAHPTSTY
jgi:uncharacterized protein YbbK (DUF523 family)